MCVCILVKVCFNSCDAVLYFIWVKSVMCWWESLLCVSQITARRRCTSWWRPDSSLSSNLTPNTPSWTSESTAQTPHPSVLLVTRGFSHRCEIIAYSKAACESPDAEGSLHDDRGRLSLSFMMHCCVWGCIRLEIDRYIGLPKFCPIFKHFTIIGYWFCKNDIFFYIIIIF